MPVYDGPAAEWRDLIGFGRVLAGRGWRKAEQRIRKRAYRIESPDRPDWRATVGSSELARRSVERLRDAGILSNQSLPAAWLGRVITLAIVAKLIEG